MENKATTKTPIPTRSGFSNFALCTLIFALRYPLSVCLFVPLCLSGQYPRSTLVETPLQIPLFFAKQSQFQNGQYKHKYSKNKGLCQRTTNNEPQTLLKTNPIKPNFKRSKPISNAQTAYPACLPSTLVETPLQISLFSAKQSQFQNGQYKHKYSKNKGLCQRTTNNEQPTPFKTNPNKPNSPAPLQRSAAPQIPKTCPKSQAEPAVARRRF